MASDNCPASSSSASFFTKGLSTTPPNHLLIHTLGTSFFISASIFTLLSFPLHVYSTISCLERASLTRLLKISSLCPLFFSISKIAHFFHTIYHPMTLYYLLILLLTACLFSYIEYKLSEDRDFLRHVH